MPEERKPMVLERQYSIAEHALMVQGEIPQSQDDRWFVWVGDDSVVHLHRSWTGFEIFQVLLRPTSEGYEVAEAWVNGDSEQHTSSPEVEDAFLGPMLDRLAGR